MFRDVYLVYRIQKEAYRRNGSYQIDLANAASAQVGDKVFFENFVAVGHVGATKRLLLALRSSSCSNGGKRSLHEHNFTQCHRLC